MHERLQLLPCFKLKHSYTVYIIIALTKPYGPSQGMWISARVSQSVYYTIYSAYVRLVYLKSM